MTETIYHLINYYGTPLYRSLYSSPYFFIDYWSFVHLISGILIVRCTTLLRWRRPFLILGLILVSWEALEISFIYVAVHIFKPENIPDQLTDIIIGFLGGYISFLIFQPEKRLVSEQR